MVEEFLIIHSFLGVDDQHLPDEVLSEWANLFWELNSFLVGFKDLSFCEFHATEEGVAAKEHLIGDNTETPNITFFIILFPVEYLGSHGDI